MAKITQTVPEIAADVLAAAVEKAVKVERERSERETAIAVETAKQDTKTENRLDGHEERLDAINGSVRDTKSALIKLTNTVDSHFDKQEKRNVKQDTEQAVHWKAEGQAYSKKMVYSGFGAMMVMLAIPFITETIKLIAG